MKRTELKRKTRLNPVSLKKIKELQDEVPIRMALCERAGGTPILGKRTYRINGKPYLITTVQCYGGICECGCKTRVDGAQLHPHEKVFRSHGGILSLENSIMVINEHHARLQNNELRWSRKGE